jgi:hypothetical protein
MFGAACTSSSPSFTLSRFCAIVSSLDSGFACLAIVTLKHKFHNAVWSMKVSAW